MPENPAQTVGTPDERQALHTALAALNAAIKTTEESLRVARKELTDTNVRAQSMAETLRLLNDQKGTLSRTTLVFTDTSIILANLVRQLEELLPAQARLRDAVLENIHAAGQPAAPSETSPES